MKSYISKGLCTSTINEKICALKYFCILNRVTFKLCVPILSLISTSCKKWHRVWETKSFLFQTRTHLRWHFTLRLVILVLFSISLTNSFSPISNFFPKTIFSLQLLIRHYSSTFNIVKDMSLPFNIYSLNYQNFVCYITFYTSQQLSLITGFDTQEK